MKKATIKMLSVIMIIIIGISAWGCDLVNTIYPDTSVNTDGSNGLTVHFVDVGQGDCILLESDGHFALIDAGEYSERYTVISYLSSHGVKSLDCIIATHPHSDHCGALSEVIRSFDTGVLVSPAVESYSNTWENVLDAADERGVTYDTPNRFDTYSLSEATITVLSPDKNSLYSSLNNYSIVCMVDYADTSFLLMGDAEKTVENELLRLNLDLSADVIKCGHHGSSSSSSRAFIEAVKPSVAVLSCGSNNDYGHPHKETLSTLSRYGITSYRTDKCGSIIMHSDGKTITVTTSKDNSSSTIPDKADLPSVSSTYIGNKNSKVFHFSDCSSLDSMKESNKVYFSSREEAVNSGYSPCKACQP